MNDQQELDLRADVGWFHIMRPRIMQGLIAEVGETAWAVYCAIKAHTRLDNGVATISQARIGELVGKSPITVARATEVLMQKGLLAERLVGRHKEYVMVETAEVKDRQTGVVQATADFRYVPSEFKKQIDSIKAYLREGLELPAGITFNLNVTLINQRDGGQVISNPTYNVISGRDGVEKIEDLVKKLKGL